MNTPLVRWRVVGSTERFDIPDTLGTVLPSVGSMVFRPDGTGFTVRSITFYPWGMTESDGTPMVVVVVQPS